MNASRTYFFIAVSSVALVAVLAIQVGWIMRTAKVKEELFNEKAGMVLSKTAEAIDADSTIRNTSVLIPGSPGMQKIDSLFRHYMSFYKVQTGYYFEVKKAELPVNTLSAWSNFSLLPSTASARQQPGCYTACLPPATGKDALELKLIIPGKEQFIRAEMGLPFISSVLLILLVLVLSWRTILSLVKAKRLSERTTDFLNNMTHELKTPITNISLAGRMIIRDQNVGNEEKIKHYSGIILGENEKLHQQVEQVLSMTALERGEIPLQKTETDVHLLVSNILKSISVQLEHRQGNALLHADAQHFVVMADAVHLSNAICNLLDNAIKYAKGAPEITIRTDNPDGMLRISVRDNGIGIGKAYQKKVFDKFFRVPTGNVHNVKGFGLGLAYTHRIVSLHGGAIMLQSEKGEGTEFIITLPYA